MNNELKIAKLNWRAQMRAFFGPTWTKRKACRRTKDGRTMMNIPS